MGHPEATLVMVGHDRTLVSLPRGVYCTLHSGQTQWPRPSGNPTWQCLMTRGHFRCFFKGESRPKHRPGNYLSFFFSQDITGLHEIIFTQLVWLWICFVTKWSLRGAGPRVLKCKVLKVALLLLTSSNHVAVELSKQVFFSGKE